MAKRKSDHLTDLPAPVPNPADANSAAAASSAAPPPPHVTLSPTADSSNAPYKVYISYAREDRVTIAIPLRKKLREHGISAFLDDIDMPPGTEASQAMIKAMKNASVAVLVLSPEFIAHKWPMKELMFLLKRHDQCMAAGVGGPIIIPFFYRLRVLDLDNEPRLDRKDRYGANLYEVSRFNERQRNGEPEANIAMIKAALRKVRGFNGVASPNRAHNDKSFSYIRTSLVEALARRISLALSRLAIDRLRRALEPPPTLRRLHRASSKQDQRYGFISIGSGKNGDKPMPTEDPTKASTYIIPAFVGISSGSLTKLCSLVNALSNCSSIRDALAAVRRSKPIFDGVPTDGYGEFFSLKKVMDHGAMARVSGGLRDTIAGPEFNALRWSSPGWPPDGLSSMDGTEVMETLAMKAEYTKYSALAKELESLSAVEDVCGTLMVRAKKKLSINTTTILTGLLFGKKTDCSSSFITWVYKAQITALSVQFSDGVTRALLLSASQATRTRYYSPDVCIGASAVPLLIRRFHYELRRRFDHRRSSSEYERDHEAVCEAMCHALCREHMENTDLIEPLLAVLYVRRGDCAMKGRCAVGNRSLPCVLCLYGLETPKRVKNPMIYSNRLIEEGETVEDDLKTIDEIEMEPDYCDRWGFKLLSLLFSGNWNAMECAVYKSKVPVIAGQKLRTILKQMLQGDTNMAIQDGITPWVVFEVCQSYRLNASHFIQSMYDCSVGLVNSGDETMMPKVDRILGGIAAIYDYKKLNAGDPENIMIGSESGGITGCLYLYNAMEDGTFAYRYIFHRWLMERAYKLINAQNDLQAMEYWCSVYAIAMEREGLRLTFEKGPWQLTGMLEERGAGYYHYRHAGNDVLFDDVLVDVLSDENLAEQYGRKITFICD